MFRTLNDYQDTVGSVIISQLRQLANKLKGAKVVHVNSTRLGGGVAEILNWLVPLMNDLGLEASWEVIEGSEDYFKVTKAMHNGLQGSSVILSESMISNYEKTVAMNGQRLRSVLEDADFVFVHDPQPAALLEHCPNRRGKWIWRCHIDVSHPKRSVWKYLKTKLYSYDASIFSLPDFAQSLPHPQFIIAPSIDPLSDKNRSLDSSDVSKTLECYGIRDDIPFILQVSRFDRFKDPLGVIEAFKLVRKSKKVELVLAGGEATDDPEGIKILEEVKEAAATETDIHVLSLPSDAHLTINALQQASTIVVQKSLQEGFGLTVAEAMWKKKPVIGGNVGGIRLQVHNNYTGFLVNTPEGTALRILELIRRPERIKMMGETAKVFIKDNFLLTRQLREYFTLILSLRDGLANYLITE